MARILRLLLLALVTALVGCAPTSAPGSPAWALATRTLALSTGYWSLATRTMATTPYGHPVALACHNCYDLTLAATTTKVQSALTDGADLIELDVTQHPDGEIYVEHAPSTDATRPLLSDVLAIPELAAASTDQLLFVEVKETAASPDAFGRKLLDTLSAGGYPRLGRPVILRGFKVNETAYLDALRALLDTTYACLSGLFRIQVLLEGSASAPADYLRTAVDDAVIRRYDGIELPTGHYSLFSGITYAKARGLGVNVFTIPGPSLRGDVFLGALRDEVDALTTDYPLAAARSVLEADTALVYVNASQQSGPSSIDYWRSDTTPFSAPVNAVGSPTFTFATAAGDNLYGGVLGFSGAEYLRTYDAEGAPLPGLLLSASVSFDTLAIADGDTSVILGKADGAGFTLELFNPLGGTPSQIRAGFHSNALYRYAVAPITWLTTTRSHFIVAAFDGSTGAQLWIDGNPATAAAPTTGVVTPNNSDILLGADPQGATLTRFYFRGRIQHALVQGWTVH